MLPHVVLWKGKRVNWQGCRQKEPMHCVSGIKIGRTTTETKREFLTKIQSKSSWDQAILLLVKCLEGIKSSWVLLSFSPTIPDTHRRVGWDDLLSSQFRGFSVLSPYHHRFWTHDERDHQSSRRVQQRLLALWEKDYQARKGSRTRYSPQRNFPNFLIRFCVTVLGSLMSTGHKLQSSERREPQFLKCLHTIRL